MNNSFVLPVFARGTGLGNRLFQWSRARVYHYTTGAQFVSPFWLRLSLGHLIRRTVPLDQYLGRIALAGLFTADPHDLRPIIHPWLHLRCRVIRESSGKTLLPASDQSDQLFYVDGRDDSFTKLNPHQARLRADLLRIVAPNHRRRVAELSVPAIGLNIRLGKDFSPPPNPSDRYDWVGWLQQTPLLWFIETLELIRECCGWTVPAIVVSDGSPSQLRPLLRLPSVTHLSPSNAIVDLMVLSRTKLLLGSGSSTFSAWAGFLGQQPAFTAPGHPFVSLDLQPLQGQMIAAFDPKQPDPIMLKAMVEAVT